MGNLKALRSFREIEGAGDVEKSGLIALHLGLYDEAKEMYTAANRQDLLNDFYQTSGSWEASLEASNIIGKKKEFFKFGKYLSDIGDTTGAIAAFEKAGNHW